jgi:integrase
MDDAYRLVATPKFEFPYQVVRSDGLPDVPLTLFAREQLQSLSASSVPLYLREIVAFLNWSKSDPVVQRYQWRIDGSPTEVRNMLREYLTVAAKCKLTSRADGLGVKATYVVQAAGNTINIRTLLAALKRLFEMLIARGMYHHANPLLHEDTVRLASGLRKARRDAFRKAEGRLPMPAASGVDPPSGIRLSENYFRCVERQWWPRTIDDHDLPSLVYVAGKNSRWSLRELCIARMLFESGARISEICSLTAADWARSRFGASFDAPNKGSHGGRTKLLLVSQPTVKLLHKYFDGESDRRACDGKRLTMKDLLTLVDQTSAGLRDISLFLTRRGTVLSARLFREHYWKPALRAAGLDVDPHQGRHWFVTNALRNIEASATSDTDLRRKKEELIQYMAWKTGERTLAAYEHVQRREQFLDTLTAIHHKMARRSKQRPPALSLPQPSELIATVSAAVVDQDLCLLTGKYDDN